MHTQVTWALNRRVMVSQAKRVFNINIARELTIYPSSDKLSAHVEIGGFAIYCLQPQPGKHRLWFDAQIGNRTHNVVLAGLTTSLPRVV